MVTYKDYNPKLQNLSLSMTNNLWQTKIDLKKIYNK